MAEDGTLSVKAGSLGGTSMRYHELAVQRWLNHLFFVREGYPVPVVFTSPMDAFAHFQNLWKDSSNPFKYLLNLKDEETGKALYEPHPSPVRYPIISVHRKGWKTRPYQNFSIHRWRRINWPTVSDDVSRCDLASVTTSRMPMAWNYRFQIDHFCTRPDIQAFYTEQVFQEFWRSGGAEPQTWILVDYPGWGQQLVRLYIDGEVENATPEEPEQDRPIEFRTTFSVVVEGFDVDIRYETHPALWKLVINSSAVAPSDLENAFELSGTVDLRIQNDNPTLNSRSNVPSDVECTKELKNFGEPEVLTIILDAGVEMSTTVGIPTVVATS